jgi:hypothetical protein
MAHHNTHTVRTANDDGKVLKDKSRVYAIQREQYFLCYGTAQCTHTVQTADDDEKVLEDRRGDFATEISTRLHVMMMMMAVSSLARIVGRSEL